MRTGVLPNQLVRFAGFEAACARFRKTRLMLTGSFSFLDANLVLEYNQLTKAVVLLEGLFDQCSVNEVYLYGTDFTSDFGDAPLDDLFDDEPEPLQKVLPDVLDWVRLRITKVTHMRTRLREWADGAGEQPIAGLDVLAQAMADAAAQQSGSSRLLSMSVLLDHLLDGVPETEWQDRIEQISRHLAANVASNVSMTVRANGPH